MFKLSEKSVNVCMKSTFIEYKRQENEVTCHMLPLKSLIKSLVPLVGLEAHRSFILSQAVRNLTVTRATHLEANPSVAKK